VLFINADREFFEGRAQNHLMPEHIEKIVTTYDAFNEVPGFSAIVDIAPLRKYGYNLNIRRFIVPTLRRGNAVKTLQRHEWQRWSVAKCVPTSERGNDVHSTEI
ncbi:MAG: N-6 DNA methylase, partial [Methylobacter sp.]